VITIANTAQPFPWVNVFAQFCGSQSINQFITHKAAQ